MTTLRNVLLAATVLLVPTRAGAQDFGKTQLEEFSSTGFHRELMMRAVAAVPTTVFRRCPGLVSHDSQVTIMRPLVFAANGVPTAGAWRESFPVSGCGNDTILNFFFAATPEGRVNTVLGMPGATRADPALQHDALKFAVLGATNAAKACKQFDVLDTQTSGAEPAPAPPGGLPPPWHETWTLLGCGRAFAVPLDFVPDATGTTITQPGGVIAR